MEGRGEGWEGTRMEGKEWNGREGERRGGKGDGKGWTLLGPGAPIFGLEPPLAIIYEVRRLVPSLIFITRRHQRHGKCSNEDPAVIPFNKLDVYAMSADVYCIYSFN
jgi:hypothetical protein